MTDRRIRYSLQFLLLAITFAGLVLAIPFVGTAVFLTMVALLTLLGILMLFQLVILRLLQFGVAQEETPEEQDDGERYS